MKDVIQSFASKYRNILWFYGYKQNLIEEAIAESELWNCKQVQNNTAYSYEPFTKIWNQ